MTAEPLLGDDDSLYCKSNRIDMVHILEQIPGQEEIWDEETKVAYERTLSYIGTIKKLSRMVNMSWIFVAGSWHFGY